MATGQIMTNQVGLGLSQTDECAGHAWETDEDEDDEEEDTQPEDGQRENGQLETREQEQQEMHGEEQGSQEGSLEASDRSILETVAPQLLPPACFASNRGLTTPERQTETKGEHLGEPAPSLPQRQVETGSSSSRQAALPQMGYFQDEYNAHVTSSRLEYRSNACQQGNIPRSRASDLIPQPIDFRRGYSNFSGILNVTRGSIPWKVLDRAQARAAFRKLALPCTRLRFLVHTTPSIPPTSILFVVAPLDSRRNPERFRCPIGSRTRKFLVGYADALRCKQPCPLPQAWSVVSTPCCRVVRPRRKIASSVTTNITLPISANCSRETKQKGTPRTIQYSFSQGRLRGSGSDRPAKLLRLDAYRTALQHLRLLPSQLVSPGTYHTSSIYKVALIPSTFSVAQVLKLIDIFGTHSPYVPTLVTMSHNSFVWLSGPPDSILSSPVEAMSSQPVLRWPMGMVPVELFHRIARELSREDVMNMRLVSREFEKNVSELFFRVVVIPFRAQIYLTNIARDDCVSSGKGKGKAEEMPGKKHRDGLQYDDYTNRTEKGLYDGMKVFKAYGHVIEKFAMTFEADEDLLSKPPAKDRYETITAFWGEYKWPRSEYIRYEACEYLEKKADDTNLMVSAFSNLCKVRELGLSVNNGLGWIIGPDRSDREEIFVEKPEVLESRFLPSRSKSQARLEQWTDLMALVELNTVYPAYPVRNEEANSITNYEFPPLIFGGVDYEALPLGYFMPRSRVRDGMQVWLREVDLPDHTNPFMAYPLVPNQLTTEQKEWLLETRWAQEAFLTTWHLSLVKNAATFHHVHTLTLASFSSGHLEKLHRRDIWTSLGNLKNLTIMVLPDWLEVESVNAGYTIDSVQIEPSLAAHKLHGFLEACVTGADKLNTLKVGYVGGGERAKGLFARNKHVLPALIAQYRTRDDGLDVSCVKGLLKLPYIQHLTLSNCWVTPDALKGFVHEMHSGELSTLVLDSVSLTAQPGQNAPLFDPGSPVPPVVRQVIAAATIKYPQQMRHPHLSVQQKWIQKLLVRDNDVTFVNFPIDADAWLAIKLREGSWPNVMDAITPGETLDEKLLLAGYIEDKPLPRSSGSLTRIEFVSCGYIYLKELDFAQDSLMEPAVCKVFCLSRRVQDLNEVMMKTKDKALGQIVTFIDFNELITLMKVWGMTHGWGDDDGSQWETREDGQSRGGSGRFSGLLESL